MCCVDRFNLGNSVIVNHGGFYGKRANPKATRIKFKPAKYSNIIVMADTSQKTPRCRRQDLVQRIIER